MARPSADHFRLIADFYPRKCAQGALQALCRASHGTARITARRGWEEAVVRRGPWTWLRCLGAYTFQGLGLGPPALQAGRCIKLVPQKRGYSPKTGDEGSRDKSCGPDRWRNAGCLPRAAAAHCVPHARFNADECSGVET